MALGLNFYSYKGKNIFRFRYYGDKILRLCAGSSQRKVQGSINNVCCGNSKDTGEMSVCWYQTQLKNPQDGSKTLRNPLSPP